METLAQFKQRTQYVYQPMPLSPLTFNPNLSMKVNEEGKFNPFYGDTVVYLLNSEIKAQLAEMQKTLMESCSDLFAEPLIEDTFHLTLHDLNNSPNHYQIAEKMDISQKQVQSLLNQMKRDSSVIHLKSTKVFSMVNTSVVLCFEPETDKDCQKLMEYYELFQQIVPLPYPLTPHITLAYYNAPYTSQDEYGNWIKGRLPAERIAHLKEIMDILNSKAPIHLELTVYDLAYQQFSSMNHYMTKFKLPSDRRETMLIVDDAAFMRKLMIEFLKDEPLLIDEAATGTELIRYLDEKEPDYILLDHTLPDLNSFDLLEIIHEEYPAIRVVYLSTVPICKEKLMKMGASVFINKPLKEDTFLKEIHALIHQNHI